MKLRELLISDSITVENCTLEYSVICGSLDNEITDILYDSRKAKEDTAFICMIGAVTDGHRYIKSVLENGCRTLIIQRRLEELDSDTQNAIWQTEGVTVIQTKDNRKALSIMAQALFDYPARKLTMIGITGTKGKTTTSFMLRRILENSGHKVGVIGTTGVYIGEEHIVIHNTTPESYDVQMYLQKMADAGCDCCVMEVSSQAMKLSRVAGLEYDYSIFTNLSPDHIGEGEHADYDEYVYCKSLLFAQSKHVICNADDKETPRMMKAAKGDVRTYGFGKDADFVAGEIEYIVRGSFIGIGFDISGKLQTRFEVNTPGRFSAYNAMAAIATAHWMGISEEPVKEALTNTFVRGRVESVPVSEDFTVLIDYAHNAMSMESILSTMREYQPERIVSLFGCGGNRSKLRRYEMGEVSGRLADLSIITADNSRFEDVMDIIEDIKVGLHKTDGEYVVIPDRKEAIRYSIEHAKKGDIILLLGKGHEDYQDIGGVRHHFDEREIIQEIIKKQ